MTTLKDMLNHDIGMLTTVIIGNSSTMMYEGLMVTPRGYQRKYTLNTVEQPLRHMSGSARKLSLGRSARWRPVLPLPPMQQAQSAIRRPRSQLRNQPCSAPAPVRAWDRRAAGRWLACCSASGRQHRSACSRAACSGGRRTSCCSGRAASRCGRTGC